MNPSKQKEYTPLASLKTIEITKMLLDDKKIVSNQEYLNALLLVLENEKPLMDMLTKHLAEMDTTSINNHPSPQYKTASPLNKVIEIIDHPQDYVHPPKPKVPLDSTAPSPATTTQTKPLSQIVVTDVCDTPVTAALARENRAHNLAEQFFTRWKQFHRARVLHPSIFNSFRGNSLNNRTQGSQFPKPFRHLLTANIPPLFNTTVHFSNNLQQILHDGVLYSKESSKVSNGISTQLDAQRFDHKLVFTAPFAIHFADSITFSLSELLKQNPNNRLYFKFYDWASSPNTEVQLAPGIKLVVTSIFPNTTFTFITSEGREFTVILLADELTFHGYEGLNRFLTFLLFKVINRLPPQADELKQRIYEHFAHLDQQGNLVDYLQKQIRQLLFNCEADFISKVILSFKSIQKISFQRRDYNFESIRSAIAMDAVDFFAQLIDIPLFESSYFLIKQMLDYAVERRAISITQYLSMKFKDLLDMPYQVELLRRAQYVYDNHLSKRYTETHLTAADASLTIDGTVIERPNHALQHVLTKTHYLKNVIAYFKNFAKDPAFRLFCNNLTAANILEIQTILFFSVTGRESDVSFSQNPIAYTRYREQSAIHFEQFAEKNGYLPEQLSFNKELIRHLGNPLYPTKISNTAEKNYVFHIADLTHRLHLMRCTLLPEFLTSVAASQAELEDSRAQKLALADLFKLVTQLTQATGGRLMCSFNNGQMSNHGCPYNAEIFQKASTNPTVCMKLLCGNAPSNESSFIKEQDSSSKPLKFLINKFFDNPGIGSALEEKILYSNEDSPTKTKFSLS